MKRTAYAVAQNLWKNLLLGGVVMLTLSACINHYDRGLDLEAVERWEEASLEFHLALVEDPEDEDVQAALQRTNVRVAQDNMERYHRYLAASEFNMAYQRLLDAARQDPQAEGVQEELAKWQRVLLAGQVSYEFQAMEAEVTRSDEIRLLVWLNTPNPGEMIEAEVDPVTGVFFAEHLAYQMPQELLAYYTMNSFGMAMRRATGPAGRYSTWEQRRFFSYRTPVVVDVSGKWELSPSNSTAPLSVLTHRQEGRVILAVGSSRQPRQLSQYGLSFYPAQGVEQFVGAGTLAGELPLYTPETIYVNRQDRRMLVDFGHYRLYMLKEGENQWQLWRNLDSGGTDYFNYLFENLALQPYFQYRESVLRFRR